MAKFNLHLSLSAIFLAIITWNVITAWDNVIDEIIFRCLPWERTTLKAQFVLAMTVTFIALAVSAFIVRRNFGDFIGIDIEEEEGVLPSIIESFPESPSSVDGLPLITDAASPSSIVLRTSSSFVDGSRMHESSIPIKTDFGFNFPIETDKVSSVTQNHHHKISYLNAISTGML